MRPIADFSDLGWMRRVLIVVSLVLLFVAATGLVETKAFAVPSLLKYGITIAAPLCILIGALIERPLHLITMLLIIAAPFSAANAHLSSARVSVMVPLFLLGFLLFALSDFRARRWPALAWSAVLVLPLLFIPLVDGANNHTFIISILLLVGVAVLVAKTCADKGGLMSVLVAVAIEASLQAAVAIWEAKTGHTLNLYSSTGGTQYGSNYSYTFGGTIRPTGTFGDPIGLANALAFVEPLLLGLALIVRDWRLKVVVVAVMGLVVAALGLALDRTSWIGVASGLALTVVILPPQIRRPLLPWFLAGVVITVGVIVAVEGSTITQKFSSIFHPTRTTGQSAEAQGEAYGEQDRLQYWSIAVRYGLFRHPLFGIGLDRMQGLILDHSSSDGLGVRAGTAGYANAASTYLQVIGDAGICGVVFFLSVFYGLWTDLREAYRRQPVIAAALAGAVLAVLVCWVTDVVVITEEPVAACVGVLFGAVAGVARGQTPNGSGDQRLA